MAWALWMDAGAWAHSMTQSRVWSPRRCGLDPLVRSLHGVRDVRSVRRQDLRVNVRGS